MGFDYGWSAPQKEVHNTSENPHFQKVHNLCILKTKGGG
jgi:hypothetical protein